MKDFFQDPYIQDNTHPLLLEAWQQALHFNPSLYEQLKKIAIQLSILKLYARLPRTNRSTLCLIAKILHGYEIPYVQLTALTLTKLYPKALVKSLVISQGKQEKSETWFYLPIKLENELITLLQNDSDLTQTEIKLYNPLEEIQKQGTLSQASEDLRAEWQELMQEEREEVDVLQSAGVFLASTERPIYVQLWHPLLDKIPSGCAFYVDGMQNEFSERQIGIGFSDCGIFTAEVRPRYWQNHPILTYLFNSKSPVEKEIRAYKKQHSLCLNFYTSYSKQFEIFLYLLALENANSDKSIDVLIPFMKQESLSFVGGLLEKTKISKIILIHLDTQEKSMTLYENAIAGKQIRLIACSLPDNLYEALLFHAEPFVGLGDTIRLGQILALKKKFVLELTDRSSRGWDHLFQLLSHLNCSVWLKIAEELFDRGRFGSDRIAENVHFLISTTKAQEELNKLQDFLIRYSNLENSMSASINRAIWHAQNATLQAQEKLCVDNWMQGRFSADEITQQFLKKMQAH